MGYEWPLTPMGVDLAREDTAGDAGYMLGNFKLLVDFVLQDGWTGQFHPNNTQPWDSYASLHNCTLPGKIGCLFNVVDDPEERKDLALEMPEKAAEIYAKMQDAQKTWYNTDRGSPNKHACGLAISTGFWRPYLHRRRRNVKEMHAVDDEMVISVSSCRQS